MRFVAGLLCDFGGCVVDYMNGGNMFIYSLPKHLIVLKAIASFGLSCDIL